MANELNNPIFQDETAAREWLEARLWPQGPICPHCGVVDQATLMKGKSHRPGLYQCNACREPFTVTVGTLYERSKIPLTKWLMATYLLMSSKKGMSAKQMSRMLGISYKSTWFLMHRIRESLANAPKRDFGSEGGAVEMDETYYGVAPDADLTKHQNWAQKNKIVSLIDRDTGAARSIVVGSVDRPTVARIMRENISRNAHLITDEAQVYRSPGVFLASKHSAVNHSKDEWVSRANPEVHTQTIEGFFSIFKRGMKGVYQHCGSQHLHRYVAEFDFRYSNRVKLGVDDMARTERAITGIAGKRLTYRRINAA